MESQIILMKYAKTMLTVEIQASQNAMMIAGAGLSPLNHLATTQYAQKMNSAQATMTSSHAQFLFAIIQHSAYATKLIHMVPAVRHLAGANQESANLKPHPTKRSGLPEYWHIPKAL